MWFKNEIIFKSHKQIREFMKGTLLPPIITDGFLLENGFVKIIETAQPEITTLQFAYQDGIEEINGTLQTKWIIVDKSPEQIEAEHKALVPSSITKVQAMLQLKALGLWDTFKTFLASNDDANDIWTLAMSVDRDNSFVPIMAQVVGWDEVQTDNFFIEAVKL